MKARMFIVAPLLLLVAGCAVERLKTKTEFSVDYKIPLEEDCVDSAVVETVVKITIFD